MSVPDDTTKGEAARTGSRSRVLSIVVTGGLITLVASCCLCGGIVYQQWPTFRNDREAANSLTREILPVTVPAVFTPAGTIEWNIWMFLQMRGAYYTLENDAGELSFLEVDSRFINNPEFRQHIIKSLREHGAGGGFDLAVRSAETKVYDVAGKSVEFNFLQAEDRTTGSDRRLVDGIVDGHAGPVMVSLWVDEESWDPQMVDDMIASISAQ